MRPILPATLLCIAAAPALAAPPAIVADTPVTGALVQQVLGDLGQVSVLLGSGANLHDYQMRPSEARALQSSDLLIWVGPQLTPWLDRAADNLGADHALTLLDVPGTYLQDFSAAGVDEHDHDHEDGHAHEDEDEHADDPAGHDDHDDHSHSGLDPHAWLDPTNAQVWTAAIAEQLAERDPDNAATYRANAEAADQQIAALDGRLEAQLAPIHDKPFLVFHDAYGYFTAHYGLTPPVSVSLGDASTPSAARLAEIRAEIEASGTDCAFPEFGHDASLIDSVIKGDGVRVGAALDPAGRGLAAGPDFYVRLMQALADSLTTCLSAGN